MNKYPLPGVDFQCVKTVSPGQACYDQQSEALPFIIIDASDEWYYAENMGTIFSMSLTSSDTSLAMMMTLLPLL